MSLPEPEARVITHAVPSDGIPAVAASQQTVAALTQALASGTGPISVDAERASGYRYSQRAYLLQFAREGAGIGLLDPVSGVDLSQLTAVVNAAPWILHAATQDLPCLREVGFIPTSVFDTELAGRLLGRAKVGLSALLEEELGVVLAKEHSAVDWSQRPMPDEWLAYAALDVEFLVELHERLLMALDTMGRGEWYEQERQLLLNFRGPAPREEPWRRVSGIHALHDARKLAIVRALWEARDARAQEVDVSPGRVLHDSIIIDIAKHAPASQRALEAMRPIHNRNARKDPVYWWSAIERALHLSEEDLPRRTATQGSIPPPRSWPQRFPEASDRWERIRPVVVAIAEEIGIGAEVLVSPEAIRQVCWKGCTPADVDEALAAEGARAWQRALLTPPIAEALEG